MNTLLQQERAQEILAVVTDKGSATVRALAEQFAVTEVTIRRDLKRLDGDGLVRRTHGGVMRVGAAGLPGITKQSTNAADVRGHEADALVLAPVQHNAARTLQARAVRNGIPMLAESAPRDGAVYVGPDNMGGARSLGLWTAGYLRKKGWKPIVLDVTLDQPNTRERSDGFLDGLRTGLGTEVSVVSANGLGVYGQSYQVATDALRLHSGINVLFGVNDDTVLGALQAYRDLGRDPDHLMAVNVGGEGDTLFDELARGGPLKACLALFPHAVGRAMIDTAARIWAGAIVGTTVTTPHHVMTADTIDEFYQRAGKAWMPVGVASGASEDPLDAKTVAGAHGRRISFVIQYRTHEWYQNLAQAMSSRAQELAVQFAAIDVKEDYEAEIAELRRLIGKLAASYVEDGETVILDSGTPTVSMARYLHGRRDLTVITNSVAVFLELRDDPAINVVLVGGNYDRASGCFVGRAAHLALGEVRADKAFLVAGGLSTAFGLSSRTPEEADVRRSMIASAHEVVVLADHTAVGNDSRVRVADIGSVHTIVTDAAVASGESLQFAQRGIRILVAGRVAESGTESRWGDASKQSAGKGVEAEAIAM